MQVDTQMRHVTKPGANLFLEQFHDSLVRRRGHGRYDGEMGATHMWGRMASGGGLEIRLCTVANESPGQQRFS